MLKSLSHLPEDMVVTIFRQKHYMKKKAGFQSSIKDRTLLALFIKSIFKIQVRPNATDKIRDT